MAAFNKFDIFVKDLVCGKHDFANDTISLYLTNAAPSNNDDHIKSELAEITSANGYNQAPLDITVTENANVTEVTANNDITWTANSGSFGPFRYIVLYNENATPDNENNACLVGWWDYGSSISCNNGESFTVDFPANKMVFTIT